MTKTCTLKCCPLSLPDTKQQVPGRTKRSQGAGAHALVDNALACTGRRPVDKDDGGGALQPFDAADLGTIWRKGLSVLGEERASAISDDDPEIAECVREGPDKVARTASGVCA